MKLLYGIAFFMNTIITLAAAYMLVFEPLSREMSWFEIAFNGLLILASVSFLWAYRVGFSKPLWTTSFLSNCIVLLALIAGMLVIPSAMAGPMLPIMAILIGGPTLNIFALLKIAGQPIARASSADESTLP